MVVNDGVDFVVGCWLLVRGGYWGGFRVLVEPWGMVFGCMCGDTG